MAKPRRLTLCLAPLFALCWATTARASAIDGLWLTDDRRGVVRIGPCGAHLCGWIARVLARGPGVPARDVNNPDPRLRGRTLLGLPILSGFTAAGAGFTGGQAYDPQSGRSYTARLSPNADGSLTVTGCVLFICQSKRWTRLR